MATNSLVKFAGVQKTYDGIALVVRDLNLNIQSGEFLSLLGPSGSGKTTIAELLMRMFDVTEGQILVDGKNIKEHNIEMIRSKIGYVPQDVFLFSDTISANISFGITDYDKKDIEKYATYASVYDDIVKLPNGFETLVGERGVTLSGGQKQRISIARAFMKNPDIVLLDDALSAVDTTTEQNILSYFQKALSDKTSIIISHRANNLLNYDKIIVLENGQIVEEGTHDDLISTDGFYNSVYQQQMMQIM